jgi:hypothetical protein
MSTWTRKKIASPEIEVDDFDGGLNPHDAVVTIRWSDGSHSYEMASSVGGGREGRSAEFYVDGKPAATGVGPVTSLEGWESLYAMGSRQMFADVSRFARDASRLTTDAIKRLKKIRR